MSAILAKKPATLKKVYPVYHDVSPPAIMQLVYRLKQLILAFGDLLAFLTGFLASLSMRYQAFPSAEQIENNRSLFFIMFLLWIVVNYINGLYDLGRDARTSAFYRRIAEAAGISLVLSIAFFYLLPSQRIAPKTILLLNIVTGYGLLAAWRWLHGRFVGERTPQTNIVFVGFADEAKNMDRFAVSRTRLQCGRDDPEQKFSVRSGVLSTATS